MDYNKLAYLGQNLRGMRDSYIQAVAQAMGSWTGLADERLVRFVAIFDAMVANTFKSLGYDTTLEDVLRLSDDARQRASAAYDKAYEEAMQVMNVLKKDDPA